MTTKPRLSRQRWHKCGWCGTDYGEPRGWQFCNATCRHAHRIRNAGIPLASLVVERMDLGEKLECESRSWIREPILARLAVIDAVLNQSERTHP